MSIGIRVPASTAAGRAYVHMTRALQCLDDPADEKLSDAVSDAMDHIWFAMTNDERDASASGVLGLEDDDAA